MKFENVGVNALAVAAAAGLGSVSAYSFENTAPLLVSSKLAHGVQSKYIDTLDNINLKINEITERFCSNQGGNPLIYLRVHGLDESQLSSIDFINDSDSSLKALSNLVVYSSKDELSSPPFGKSCISSVYTDMSNYEFPKWSSNTNVAVIDIFNDDDINETINVLTENINMESCIIQGIPTFQAPSNSLLKQTSDKIKEILDSTKKREDIDYDAVESELKESFDEINQMLDDSTVTIYDDEDEWSDFHQEGGVNKLAKTDGSLFDNYAFFSTGIWMSTIVFLFLAWLLSIALGWLGDLKISYKAFDKPIDFEKKLQ